MNSIKEIAAIILIALILALSMHVGSEKQQKHYDCIQTHPNCEDK